MGKIDHNTVDYGRWHDVLPGGSTRRQNRMLWDRVRQQQHAIESRANPMKNKFGGSRHLPDDVRYPDDIKTARKLYKRDPMARWLILTIVRTVLGEIGLQINTDNERLQDLWDGWWGHSDNNLRELQYQLFGQYLIDGALCVPRSVQPETGFTRIGWIDPTSITKIDTEQGNNLIRDSVAVKMNDTKMSAVEMLIIRQIADRVRAEQHNSFIAQRQAKVAEETGADEVPGPGPANTVDLSLNKGEGKRVGDVYYFAHSPGSVDGQSGLRGIPALYPVFDMLDDQEWDGQSGFYSLIHARMQLHKVALDYAGIYTAKGEEDRAQRVQDKLDSGEMLVAGGGVTVIPEGDSFKFDAPQLNAGDAEKDVENFVRMICLAFGLPPFWAGWTGSVNRALSDNAADPSVKHLQAYQGQAIAIFTEMYEDLLDQTQDAGGLSQDDRDEGYTITGPQVSSKDTLKLSQSLATVIQALNSDLLELLPDAAARELVAKAAQALGIDVDMSEGPAVPRANAADVAMIKEVMDEDEEAAA